MTELPDEIHKEIKRLCAEGDKEAEAGQFAAAFPLYWAAFDLLPEPKTDWEAGTWVLAAIGDANFLSGDFEAGRDNLSNAMHFSDAIGNPFLHLRLGQCQFELGNPDRAADELMRAYMGEGAELFADEDPKYLEFLATRAQGIALPKKKPAKGWQFWKK
jgi:tetratricopeptide (TPR) repeat protein